MADFWYCNKCGYGPHDPQLHLACIMCGTINVYSFSTESPDIRSTDLLNFSKVRPRELKDPFNDLQSEFADDFSEGSSVLAGKFSVTIEAVRLPVSAPQRDQLPKYED